MVQKVHAETIFAEAIEITSAQERTAYLDRACQEAPGLRQEIEKLVMDYFRAGDFLQQPLARIASPICTQPLRERPGTQIGPYKILQQIGEGGMGAVYMAEQSEPVQRRVALKIIKPGMDTRQVIARFAAEKQALALMDHVNIARVLDAGVTEQGRPYFVMELVHGVPITKYCDDNHLTPRQRLELFVPVCQAIQHAHQKGIIHRDIKPSNVMVTLYDGKPVPKVIDFGVAKAMDQKLTEQTLFTQYGTMVGTLEYMSPEQAAMSALGVDTRSDIYSLGVLLYELLTGSTPLSRKQMKEAAYAEILRLIKEEEPPRPSTRLSNSGEALASISAQRQTEPAKLSKLMRGELDWIVMKTLEKDRNRRYETASAFAADVQRYLSDEPVQACPPSAAYRISKFVRRNTGAVLAASLVLVALIAGVVGTTSGLLRAEHQRRIAENNEQKALDATAAERRAKDELRLDSYFHLITLAHRELSMDNLYGALKYLKECPEDLRGWEWHYLMRLCKVEPLVLRDSTEVYGMAFSSDGQRIASAGNDGKVKIWDITTREIIQEFTAHGKAACSVAFHPDGRHLASAGADRLTKVWDLATGQEVFQGPCDAIRKFGASYTVAFRPPDGRHLAAGSDEEVSVWDWNDRQLLKTVPGPEYHSIPVAFSPDGQCLATGGAWQHGLCLWDAETWRLLGTLPVSRHPVSALAFSTDGRRLASASLGRSVSLWDTTTAQLLQTLPHSGNVLGVAFSPDGRRLASAGEDKTVHVWDAMTGRAAPGREVLALHGHTDMCGCVAFSPDGRRLASASTDGTIRVWDATPLLGDEGQEELTFTRHGGEIRSVAVSPDGARIVSAGAGTPVKVWDAATNRESLNFTGHSLLVFSVAWHPDGRRIATAGSDGRNHAVKVWDASDGRVHYEISARGDSSTGPYQAIAFSPNGDYLVTGKLEGAVQVWHGATGQEVGMLGTHRREVRGVAFSKDGQHLATASGDGEVKLWDATRLDDKQDARLALRARVPGASLNVAFSPDSRRLATGGGENTVNIWDVRTGDLLHTLRGHSGDIYTVAFSSDKDGLWIASGGEDSAVKVWNSHTGKLVRNFRGHMGLVSSVAFSPDGRRLVSGSRDTTVKIWDVTQLRDPGQETTRPDGVLR